MFTLEQRYLHHLIDKKNNILLLSVYNEVILAGSKKKKEKRKNIWLNCGYIQAEVRIIVRVCTSGCCQQVHAIAKVLICENPNH